MRRLEVWWCVIFRVTAIGVSWCAVGGDGPTGDRGTKVWLPFLKQGDRSTGLVFGSGVGTRLDEREVVLVGCDSSVVKMEDLGKSAVQRGRCDNDTVQVGERRE